MQRFTNQVHCPAFRNSLGFATIQTIQTLAPANERVLGYRRNERVLGYRRNERVLGYRRNERVLGYRRVTGEAQPTSCCHVCCEQILGMQEPLG
jgi:hypothetical protein